MDSAKSLHKKILACTLCKDFLPLPPNPVVSFSSDSKIVVIGQAPGIKVHNTSIPWNDPSGDRLREWMDLDRSSFYDTSKLALVPMGFCYPGKGKSGDLPPRPECAKLWMDQVLQVLPKKQLILLIGQYSQKHFLADQRKVSLTATVKAWRDYRPQYFPLPHPSPRNNIWLKKNSWFEKDCVPQLKKLVKEILST